MLCYHQNTKLEIVTFGPTADRSIKYPLGVIEDVLVKVDKFYFLADFIILDLEEDRNISLILCWSSLATGRTYLMWKKWELIFRVQDDQVTVFKATLQIANVEKCFKIDTKDKQVVEAPK